MSRLNINLGQTSERGILLSTAVITLIGLGLIGLGYNTYINQNQALEDPVNVSATVTETGIDQDSSRRGGIDYQPEITFEYTYDGQQYTSTNMYPGGQKANHYDREAKAEDVVETYSQGSEMTVYVPPDTPGEAFIQAKKTNDPLIFMGIGILMIGAAGYRFYKNELR